MGCGASKKISTEVPGSETAKEKEFLASFPLSAFQKCLIKFSWRAVEEHLFDIGIATFVRFFQRCPEVKVKFYEFREMSIDELKKVDTLPPHIRAVLDALKQAVLALDEATEFVAIVESLGKGHAMHSIDEKYFEILGQCILLALGENLGEEWTEDVMHSWSTMYGFICVVMKRGMNKVTGDAG